jgi:hypothetical protein
MRRRPSTAAAFAVVLLVVGQIAAFAHEATTRHVVCSEHGELLEASAPSSTHSASSESVDSDHARWIGIDGDGSSGPHEDCAIARALRQTTDTLHASIHIGATTFIATSAAPPPIDCSFAFDRLLLIAPKTSPPA